MCGVVGVGDNGERIGLDIEWLLVEGILMGMKGVCVHCMCECREKARQEMK